MRAATERTQQIKAGLGPSPGGPGRAARLRPAGRGMSASGARAAA